MAVLKYRDETDNRFKELDISLISKQHTYTATEKIIGTWLNGKPIYERTLSFTTPTTAGDITELNAFAETVDAIINYFGYLTCSAGRIPIPFSNGTTWFACIHVTNANHFSWRGNSSSLGAPATICFQYTKKEDN